MSRLIRLGLFPAVLVWTAIAATTAPVTAGPTPGEPVLGYWTETELLVADAGGATVRTFPDFDNVSLNNNVLAGEAAAASVDDARIVGFDATSGERLFRIPLARLPVVTASGRKVAFLPSYHRDKYGASVWMRTARGTLRQIVRFKPGPGLPGIPHGMKGGAFPLEIALDDRGRTMAVVAGLEPLRSFDVWLVDVRTKEATRMTRGENSHNPSLSPDGTRLAVRVESPDGCPDPIYGEILIGKIRVISRSGERNTLTRFDCDVFYDTPRWIDNDSLLAVRVTKDATEGFGYDLDIVRIDVDGGTITEVVTEGNPCCLSVSASLGKVAFLFSDRPGFKVFDLVTQTTVDFPREVFAPHLSGENRF
jgi:Tol biopolymer transport system component